MIQICNDLSGLVLVTLDAETLEGADLRGLELIGARLPFTNLRRAVLRGADLFHADLRSANLQGADLRRASLYHARLQYANLRGADLRLANLRGAEMEGSLYDEGTRWPIFFNPQRRLCLRVSTEMAPSDPPPGRGDELCPEWPPSVVRHSSPAISLREGSSRDG
jgi:uncharacterized protein YjbI with pentapeptide repeats